MTNERDDNNTIQRCDHDEENPFAQISRDLIRDKSISPECRWLIIYILSMKDGWQINVHQLIKHLKGITGRDRIYEIINEAIEAGYMKKETIKKGNLKQQVKYFVSERPKFKKFLRHPDSQYPEIRDTGIRDTENQDYKKEHLLTEEEQQTTEQESCCSVPVVSSLQKEIQTAKPSQENPNPSTPIKQETAEKPIIWQDEEEKRALLQPYNLDSTMIEKIMSRDLVSIKSSVAAFEQYRVNKKIDDPSKAVYSAIIKGWKQNFSVKEKVTQLNKTEQTTEEVIYERQKKCHELSIKHHEGIRKRNLFKTNYCRVEEKGNHVCIGNDNLYFDDRNFDRMLNHLIRKYEIFTD